MARSDKKRGAVQRVHRAVDQPDEKGAEQALNGEEWQDIKGFEGRYQVSNFGRVKSLSRITQLNGHVREEPEQIMSYTKRSGYKTLILRKDGKRYSKQIHRLVAEAFLPNAEKLPVVNHKNYDREDNRVDNLEWCTQKENVAWSACNMYKPKKVCRLSNTGEKYIYQTKNGFYRVCLISGKITRERKFSSYEKAIQFRDETVQEIFGNCRV